MTRAAQSGAKLDAPSGISRRPEIQKSRATLSHALVSQSGFQQFLPYCRLRCQFGLGPEFTGSDAKTLNALLCNGYIRR